MKTIRVLAGAFVAMAAQLWIGGCFRDWNAYDPRLGSGGDGAGASATGVGGAAGSAGTGSGTSASSAGSSSSGSSSGGLGHCGGTSVLSANFPGTDPGEVWNPQMSGGATAAYTGGEAVVTLPSNSSSASLGTFLTNRYYNLIGDRVWVEVTSAGNTATTASASLSAALYSSSSGGFFRIYQESGTIYCAQNLGGTFTMLGSVLYSPTTHRYWQLRESEGTVYCETSPDTSTWATLGTAATASLFPLNYIQIELAGRTMGGEVSPGSTSFANVNGGGAPTGTWCPTSSLTDDFNSSTRSLAWSRAQVAAPETMAQTGGQLVFTLVPEDTKWGAYESSSSYDLTGSSLLVQVPVTASATTSGTTYIYLSGPGNNSIQMSEQQGELSAIVYANGAKQLVGSESYSASLHAWWRISESMGTLYWETSPDGKTWNPWQHLSPLPFAIDVLDINLSAGTWQAQPSPGSAAFDNCNLPPP
jgi:hypothetical protein